MSASFALLVGVVYLQLDNSYPGDLQNRLEIVSYNLL